MLFNSFSFLFFYLPVVLGGYWCLSRYRAGWTIGWLALASLFFYAYWERRFLPLLVASIVFNFWSGRAILAARSGRRKAWLIGALSVNLGLLAYYKYASLLAQTVNDLAGSQRLDWQIVLPIGISFFTFTQIAYLVDCYHGRVTGVTESRFTHYLLFVSYFPHLIAGPILHHKEMMPQFADCPNRHDHAANLAIGLSMFVAGLAKKVLIADPIAPLAAPVFALGAHPQLFEAWIGVLAYTFQLYFDFSGYCDMALGLSRILGVKLPLNFNSPYKAADIGDFWRRWHMTLSRFLRDYLYIPLGGNRAGLYRRYRNLMVTMLLGGLWHGAGWTFVVWGGLHGAFLAIHHGWQHAARNAAWRRQRYWPLAARALTFFAVMLAWVFFRAPDVGSAFDVAQALFGLNGVSLPRGLAGYGHWFGALGWSPRFDGIRWIDFGDLGVPTLGVAMLLAFFAPNTQEIFSRWRPAIDHAVRTPRPPALAWSPSARWGLAVVVLFMACILGMNRVTEFLYFQF